MAESALTMLGFFAPYWRNFTSTVKDGVSSEGFLLEHIHELGWTEAQEYTNLAKKTVQQEVVEPLKKFGIHIDQSRVLELLR